MGKPMKNILLIGGLGYLGGRMTKYFSDIGYRVLITTRKQETGFPNNIPGNTSVAQVDYNSDEQLNKVMKGIETLIHLAGPDAHTNFKDPDILVKRHLGLTRRLFQSAQSNNVKNFIYFSTIHVYGKNLVGHVTEETETFPIHPFAIAHLEAEKMINGPQKDIATTIIRCSNTFGTPYFENEKCWKLLVNNLCRSAFQNGKLVINSSGQSYRNFIAIDEVVRAIQHLLELNNEVKFNRIYNLGSTDTVQIIDIARRIQKELKNSFDYDCPIETNKSSSVNTKVESFIFSTRKKNELGYMPVSNEKEIRKLLVHCKIEDIQ